MYIQLIKRIVYYHTTNNAIPKGIQFDCKYTASALYIYIYTLASPAATAIMYRAHHAVNSHDIPLLLVIHRLASSRLCGNAQTKTTLRAHEQFANCTVELFRRYDKFYDWPL